MIYAYIHNLESNVVLNKKLWILLSLVMLILVACGQNDQHKQEDKQSNQSDSTRKSIHTNVSCRCQNTEILMNWSRKDIVGVSTVDDYPKDVKKKKQFDTMNLNKEALLKVKPDLILAHESQKGTSKVLDSLEKWRKSSLCERCTIIGSNV